MNKDEYVNSDKMRNSHNVNWWAY